MNNLHLSLLFLLLLSCSPKNRNEHLKKSLKLAGSNRSELEKVIQKYSEKPEDSLKYRAACFLIENMPYHSFYEGKPIETFKNAYQQAKTEGYIGQEAINQIVNNHHGIDYYKLKKVKDSHVVTA